jgi:pectate lyase
VIEVTNLNDSGPGSLREAISASGPRTVVFRVAGVIELERPLLIREPFLTIAGQTAPGGGITLSGVRNQDGEMILLRDVHDVVIRYLRIRSGISASPTNEPGQGQTNIAIDSGSYNILIDHCSLSWSLDENLMIHRNIPDGADPADWPGIYNITIQRSIIAEGLWPHSTGTQIGGEAEVDGWRGVHDITIHHNLYAHNSHRNPGVGASRTQVINNVVYNWANRVGSTIRDIVVDWIGNVFRPGPLSKSGILLVHEAFPKGQPENAWPAPSLYIAGNLAPPTLLDPQADNWPIYEIHDMGEALPGEFRRSEPLPSPTIPVTIQPALEAYASVLGDAGANARVGCRGERLPASDEADQRLVREVLEEKGPRRRPVAHPNEAGGYPEIEPGQPCADSDHDGMPDEWEIAVGDLNPQQDDASGYDLDPYFTNLEMYLNMNKGASP